MSTSGRPPLLYLALPTTLLLWGSAFPGIRAALDHYDPFRLALLRYGIASVVLAVLAVSGRLRLPAKRDVPRIAVVGFLGVALYNGLLNYGQTMVKAGASSFIVNTIPMFTAILSVVVLKDRLRVWGWLGMLWSFCGVTLIALGEGKGLQLNLGAVVILGAALSWSIATVLQKPLLGRYGALDMVCYGVWIGTACLCFYAPGLVQEVREAPWQATLLVVYLGVFPAALAYLCWTYVLSQVPASRASSFLYFVPIIATIVAWVWLGEVLNVFTAIGGTMALSGVMVVNTIGRAGAKGADHGRA